MRNKISLGFYSKNIFKITSFFAIIIFISITYITFIQYSNHCRSVVVKQTSIFKEEWMSKASMFSYILKNNFLPRLIDYSNLSDFGKLGGLVYQFKKELGFSNAVENIILLNSNFDIVTSSNTYQESIDNNQPNISLKNRAYLNLCRELPEKVHYGEPLIGAISKNLSLPIASAILLNNEIKGYLVISINLSNFSKELLKNNIYDSLERISFVFPDLLNEAYYVDIKEIQRGSIYNTSLWKYKYQIVEMTLMSNERIFFIYNTHKILQKFFIDYVIKISILFILLLMIFSLYILYKKNVLIPISNLYKNYYETQEKLIGYFKSKVSLDNNDIVSEIGNVEQLQLFNTQLSIQLEEQYHFLKSRDESLKLGLNCIGITLEILQKNSYILNETIETFVNDLKTSNLTIPNEILLRYLEDIYHISASKIEIIDLLKDSVNDIIPVIQQGKKNINLQAIIKEIIVEHQDFEYIKFSIEDTTEILDEVLFYSEVFRKSMDGIIAYFIDICSFSKRKIFDLKIKIEYESIKEQLIIHYALRHDGTIIDFSEDMLLNAKIYALFNSGIITNEFNTEFCIVSGVFIGAKLKKSRKLIADYTT